MRTIPLELSKQLKEAGFTQKMHFEWFQGAGHDDWELCEHIDGTHSDKNTYIAAPTADEILDLLPDEIEPEAHLSIYKDDRKDFIKWELSYSPVSDRSIVCVSDNSLSNAAALLWLYLKKNNLLES